MKTLTKTIILLVSSTVIAGCIEDNTYYSDYRDSGYYSSNPTDMTSGYNRDYHHRPRGGHYASSNVPPVNNSDYSSSQTPANSGGYSSSQTSSYSSSNPSVPANGGYSSSAGSSSGYQSSASVAQPVRQHGGGGRGMFGKALGGLSSKAKVPSPANGWSTSVPASANPSTSASSADNGYSSSSDSTKEETTQMSSSANANNGYGSGYSSSN